ncbi:uncharacterized protein LOC130673929 [Microplitis mediator]|uniref:uncharacterized protein LOC130673929 n=1 Tax=Microplitis mediator TaxID=375433 RepID=UPI002556F58A|nr:uncharacterized protein LOC130673929 [Microplitis mediator]
MAPLPASRVTPSLVFENTDVDYAGPISLETFQERGAKSFKGWIAVFMCSTTSAIHLEAVSDYSAEGFLKTLRRFISRRDLCKTLRIDCGTNFKDTLLTFEDFATCLAHVEAVLNSQPLSALSDDQEDISALTPGYFIFDEALTTIPEPSLTELTKRSPSTEGVIIRPDTPVYYLEYPHDDYLKVVRYVNKFEASPSYTYYRNPENKFSGIFFPAVLVVIDWDSKVETRTEQDILNEVLTEWNKVDKYFEKLDNPKIKLTIAGVVIPKKSNIWGPTTRVQYTEEFPDQQKIIIHSTKAYFAASLLNNMTGWFNNNIDRFENFHYIFFIYMSNWHFLLPPGTIGTSYMTSTFTCETINGPNYHSSGGIVTKNSAFSITAAKSISIMLGIYEKIGAECVYDMLADERDGDDFTWSECSKRAVRSMVNNSNHTCLQRIIYDQEEDDYDN